MLHYIALVKLTAYIYLRLTRGSDRLTDTMNNRTPPQLFHKMKRTAILAAVKQASPSTIIVNSKACINAATQLLTISSVKMKRNFYVVFLWLFKIGLQLCFEADRY